MEDIRSVDCPCRRTKCPRHGDCTACREHHRASGRKKRTYCEKRAQKQAHKAERLINSARKTSAADRAERKNETLEEKTEHEKD